MLEAVKEDVIKHSAKGSVIWHYPICYEGKSMKDWVMREKTDWVRKRFQEKIFIGDLVEAEGSSREKLIDLRSTQDTVKQSANKIIGYPLLEKEELVKNSLEWDAFEREFVDYGDENAERDYEDGSGLDNKRMSEDSLGSIYSSSRIMPELEPVPVEELAGNKQRKNG
jgi:hypothetical protein